jgi:hypothetical protein
VSSQPGGFKRVGGRSEYSIYTVWRCVGLGRGPGGSFKCETPEPRVCFSPDGAIARALLVAVLTGLLLVAHLRTPAAGQPVDLWPPAATVVVCRL